MLVFSSVADTEYSEHHPNYSEDTKPEHSYSQFYFLNTGQC